MPKSPQPTLRLPQFVRSVLLCLLLLAVAGGAAAANVDGLFSAEVPVAGRQTEQRNQAISAAYAVVLGKVSGYPQIAERPELAEELAQAARYVQQFRYRSDPDRPATETGEPAQLLQVQFDANAVTRVLRGHRLPIWGNTRPAILVWLGMDQNGQRDLASSEEEPEAWAALQRSADARGLPLLLPLFDLEDHEQLQPGDLWADAEPRIRAASARYAPDAILAVTASGSGSGSGWRVHWVLYQDNERSDWRTGGELGSALQAGVDRTADLLVARYAPLGVATGSGQTLRLWVEGIDDLDGFGRVQAHLEGMDMVQRVRLSIVQAEASLFELELAVSQAALEQALVLGGVLEPAGTVSSEPGRLDYRLRP